MKAKYFIQDWAGNDLTSHYGLFDSFDEAWEALYARFEHIEDEKEYYEELGEFVVLKVPS